MFWTTEDELDFIAGIGFHYDPEVKRKTIRPTRLELLVNYLHSIEKRSKWEGLDVERIQQFTIKCIKEECF